MGAPKKEEPQKMNKIMNDHEKTGIHTLAFDSLELLSGSLRIFCTRNSRVYRPHIVNGNINILGMTKAI